MKLCHLIQIWRYPHFIMRMIGFFIPYILRLRGVRVGCHTIFHGFPILSVFSNSSINIGENCVICSASGMTALGVNHAVVLRTLREQAVILIGDDSGISGGVICASVRVEIGRGCLLGANVVITDTDFHPIKSAGRRYNNSQSDIVSSPVIIEDNVFIGAGAFILKGVRIGKNSVIGAGSVVTKDIPGDMIAAGNPARVIKKISNSI